MNTSTDIHEAETLPPPTPSLRGYAWLKANRPERFREIRQAGGRAVAAKGNGHRWNSAEAAEAGRKGAAASHAKRQGGGR